MKGKLPADSAAYLETVRCDPQFHKLLTDVQECWTPEGIREWTPDSPVSTKERIFFEARQTGFKLLISLIRGNT